MELSTIAPRMAHAVTIDLPEMERMPATEPKGCFHTTTDKVGRVFSALKSYIYDHTNATTRNWVRVSITGTGAFLGAALASDPKFREFVHLTTRQGAWVGAVASALANMLSTYFSWETDQDRKITVLLQMIDKQNGLIVEIQAQMIEIYARLAKMDTASNQEPVITDLVKRVAALENEKKFVDASD